MQRQRTRAGVVIGTLLVMQLGWGSNVSPVAGAARQEFRTAKGFVVARSANSLTLLAGERRVLVALTAETRVLGQRQRLADIALNDVVRAEGRWAAGDHLLADRVDVVIAAGSLGVRRALVTPTFEIIDPGK